MHVELFCLCDAATNDRGKLNILGIFDTLWVGEMPAVHPHCTIALRIRFDSIEKGQHRIAVNFVDLDGKHLIPPADGVLNLDLPEGVRSGSANLVLNIQMLRIENYGEYAIDLAIDGRKEASIPLFVSKINLQ